MKATIDLPDGLFQDARALAHQQGTNLNELVVTGLRSEVRRRNAACPVAFHFPTQPGHGLMSDMSRESVLARAYGLPDQSIDTVPAGD